MQIVQIPNGQFVENCYLVVDEQARECAVVDPGEEAGLILHKLAATGAKPVAIWLTHAHIDHVLGVGRVAAETGVPVWLHPADRPLYDAVPQQAEWFGLRAPTLPPPDREFTHGDTVRVGDVSFQVRHTPGHSPGSVSLVGPGVVLGGDVLFAGSIGRTDLPGGSIEQLTVSIRERLFGLGDDCRVLPGHGPETTLGIERRTNPFVGDGVSLA